MEHAQKRYLFRRAACAVLATIIASNAVIGAPPDINLQREVTETQMFAQADDTEMELNRVLIQVTRMETIEHQGQSVEVFVVEGGGATAWVDREGRVLKQVVDNLPFLGKLILLDEPYSATGRKAAESSVPKESP